MQPGRPSHPWADGESVFFRVIPLYLCRPGGLTSLQSTVQSKKALLAVYLNEGGSASSGRAAQFMKALTLMV